MKKFKFKLQKVLEFRESLKEEKKKELMLKNQELQQAETRLEGLYQAQIDNDIGAIGTSVTAAEFSLLENYGNRLREEISKQIEVVSASKEQVQKALAEYVEAAKDFEALDKLKEKKEAAFMEHYHKEEAKFLDELSVQRRRLTAPQE